MSRSDYRNVFFYYSGPSSKLAPAEAEQAVDRQIENNATKALINLLEHSAPALTTSFLREVIELDVDDDGDGFVYSLLGARKEASAARRRHLIGLSMLGTVESGIAGDAERGVIDAAIYRPDELLVVFEVKIGNGVLKRPQLERHSADWSIDERDWKPGMRWAAIYEWATGQLSRRHDEDVTRFLLAQFVEFLDLTGLAPFIGFRAGDFDFFERPTWEKQPEVKTRLAALWDEMLELLPRERADLGKIHVGQLGLAETAHAQTNWREPGVNLTTELYANELQVNVVGWLQKDAARFEDWLISDRGRRRLNTLPGHQLIVYGRQAGNIAKRGQPGARPWFQREIVRELGCSSAPGADLEWIKGRMDELGDRKWEKAAFHLRRTWTKDEVLDKGKGIAREVADEVERLLPLVREINAATAS